MKEEKEEKEDLVVNSSNYQDIVQKIDNAYVEDINKAVEARVCILKALNYPRNTKYALLSYLNAIAEDTDIDQEINWILAEDSGLQVSNVCNNTAKCRGELLVYCEKYVISVNILYKTMHWRILKPEPYFQRKEHLNFAKAYQLYESNKSIKTFIALMNEQHRYTSKLRVIKRVFLSIKFLRNKEKTDYAKDTIQRYNTYLEEKDIYNKEFKEYVEELEKSKLIQNLKRLGYDSI